MAKSTTVVDIDRSGMAHFRDEQGIARRNNVQNITAAGAATIDRYVNSIELNNTANITATIAHSGYHSGFLLIKAVVEPADTHTVTLTTGEHNPAGNNVVSLTAIDDFALIYFDRFGNGVVIASTATTVTFS